MNVRLSKSFTFEAAHWLPTFPEGHKCRRMHGHSFRAEVIIEGAVPEEKGYLLDYGDIKAAIAPVRDALDHRCLNEIDGLENPTSEVLARWIWDRVAPALPMLCAVHVCETCTSRCEYHGEREARPVNLFVLTVPPGAGGRGRIVSPRGAGELGLADWANPLAGNWAPPDGAGRVVTWSGTLADTLFAADPATWLRPGHDALAAFCDAVATPLEAGGRTLCFVPHARHVLSDAASGVTFLKQRGDGPFEIALAPGAMLEASMLDDLDDHLRRAFEALGPVASLVLLYDVAEDGGELVPAPLGRGRLAEHDLRSLLDAHVPCETPIVLLDADLDAQRRRLGLSPEPDSAPMSS